MAQQEFGFHLGFGLAAVGMAVGLIQYVLTRKRLPMLGLVVPNPMHRAEAFKWLGGLAAALVVLLVLILTGVVTASNVANFVTILAVGGAVIIFAFLLTSKNIDDDERSRVVAFIPMFIGTAAFFALFQQQFTVLALYADTRMDRAIDFGFFQWTIPVSWAQSFNPFFIILFAPVFAALWSKLGTRGPGTPLKFALGIIFMGSAFLLFIPMAGVASVPVLWVALIMLVATWGELMISPVGLSLASKLGPRMYPVLMMALYNLSVATGTALSGSLAGFYSPENEAAYFGILGAVTIGLGLTMLLIKKPIGTAMRGIR